uniref:Myb-like domain-containing protein n=1 Tax=Rhizophora mucronata TaxID=61149 RepID=A0A2P2LJP7_RHIMU
MDPDLDPFGDIIPAPALARSTRAGGKFQPKVKQGPGKANSGSVQSESPRNAKEKVVTVPSSSLDVVKSIQPVDAVGDSLTSSLGTQKPLENIDEKYPQSMNFSAQGDSRRENLSSPDSQPAEVEKFDCNNDRHSDHLEHVVEFDFHSSAPTTTESAGELTSHAKMCPEENWDHKFGSVNSAQKAGSLQFGLHESDASNSRAGGKFQSKDKPLFEKEISASVSLSSSCGKEEPTALAYTDSEMVQDVKLTDNPVHIVDQVSPSSPKFDFVEIQKPSDANEILFPKEDSSLDVVNHLSELATTKEHTNSEDSHFAGLKPKDHGGRHSGCGESVTDVISVEFHLDPLSDVIPETSISKARTGGNFQPRAKEQPKNGASAIAPPVFTNSMKGKPISDSIQSGGVVNAVNSRLANPIGSSSTTLESDIKELEGFHDIETQDILSEAAAVSDVVESVGLQPNAEFVSLEAMYIDEGSIPAFSSDVFDYSSISFDNLIPQDPTCSQFPVNEVQINPAQSLDLDNNLLHAKDISGVPEKKNLEAEKRKDSLSDLADEVNEGDISSRQLRKRTTGPQYFDEPEYDAENSTGELPGSSHGDEEDNDPEYRLDENEHRLNEEDPEYVVESKSQKKGASRKAKKLVSGKEKPVQKQKRADPTRAQSSKEPPKKFPHSTQRKKRCVNKDLLNVPEDELDLLRLPIRDVILLAEFKEQLAVKEAKASKTPSIAQQDESLNEGDTYASEQGEDHTKVQTNGGAQSNFPLFNHHSFMDRTPTTRWSKQDTELFYEGIRHFGTDLSMIQLLFPGRTRNQVKLKLKKEERQYPLRVNEALKNPVKDHSCFEKAFEQLRQTGLGAEQESNRDDSVAVTGNEEADLITDTNVCIFFPSNRTMNNMPLWCFYHPHMV